LGSARKKGEVVGPAGGETGVPRCLAEVRKLPKAALFHNFNRLCIDSNPIKTACQAKKQKKTTGPYFPNPIVFTPPIYCLWPENASQKFPFYKFFCPPNLERKGPKRNRLNTVADRSKLWLTNAEVVPFLGVL
jgi:hypothetical protein